MWPGYAAVCPVNASDAHLLAVRICGNLGPMRLRVQAASTRSLLQEVYVDKRFNPKYQTCKPTDGLDDSTHESPPPPPRAIPTCLLRRYPLRGVFGSLDFQSWVSKLLIHRHITYRPLSPSSFRLLTSVSCRARRHARALISDS